MSVSDTVTEVSVIVTERVKKSVSGIVTRVGECHSHRKSEGVGEWHSHKSW